MKKIFTLLTLALMSIGTAWADAYTQILLFDASENGSITTTPSGDYVTLNDVVQGSGNSMYGIQFRDAISTDKYISVTLPSSKTLAAGDKIIITHYQSGTSSPNNTYGTCISASTSTTIADGCTFGIPNSQAKNAASVTYTIKEGDEFEGVSTFYVRGFSPSSSKSSYVQKIEVQKSADTRSSLTLSFTPDNQTIQVGDKFDTSLSWTEDISAEIAKYTISYSSDDESIATVTSSGKVEGIAGGTTTITATVTATSDATYKTTTATISVNVIPAVVRNENAVLPADILDLSDADAASTMLNGTWHANYGHAIFGNDGSSNYITYSVVGAYQSVSTQTWVGAYSGGSASQSWDATGVFKGSSAYNMETDRAATTKSTTAVYSFRIKGVSKIQALVSARHSTQKVVLAAFEYSGTTPAATTTLFDSYGSGNDIGTITLDLDNSKEYLITLQADGSATNSRLYEMALFYDETVALYEAITPAKEFTTYVTKNDVDFTGLGLKAYVATAASATAVMLAEVTTAPAGTPLVLEGTASTTYNVPLIATSSAPASNLLVAGDGKTTIGGDGKYDYVLKDGLFYHASSGKVPVGKAYLHLEADPATSRGMELSLDFGGGVTGISEIEDVRSKKDDVYYDLNGRRVFYPTKGLYIVNGKKIVIK